MSDGREIARAYVTIVPKTESQGTFDKVIAAAAGKSGDEGGKRLGNGLTAGVSAFSGKAGKLIAAGVAAGVGAASVAIGGFAKSSIDAGRQFDASMSQVAATMGKTVDEIGDLRDFAQEMGAKTAFSASQSADALNYMALAGYDAETSMKMLPNVLNLAASGGIELAAASDMVTDAQSALGLSIEQTTEMVDQMAKAASTTNTSVEQLGSAFLTVGGTAKVMKGGTAELSQVLGLLADNGVKGSEGGTALRNMLLSLASPTDKAAQQLDALGVAAFDSEGNMRSMKDIMLDLNAAMSDMTDEERTQAISNIFNKRDLKSVNALLGTSAERWDAVAASISDAQGAAQKMADTQVDNLEGDITMFQSALEGVQIAFADSLNPALREFVQFGSEGLRGLAAVMKTDEFSAFAADLAASFTDALRSVGEFFIGTKDVYDDLGIIVSAGQEGLFQALSREFDASGFLDALANVGAAITGVFGDESDANKATTVGEMIAGALNITAGAITGVTPLIQGAAGAVKFLADNADIALPVIGGIAVAFLTMQAVSGVSAVITGVGAALSTIGVGGGAAAVGLSATAGGEAAAGAAAASAGPPLLEVGAAVLMIGAGVALAAAGMWLLADAAVRITEAGDGAGMAMVGMTVGAVALVGIIALIGSVSTAAAPGLLALGAAVLMVGAGVAVASVGISVLAGQLPTIAAYGAASGAAVLILGTGLLVMGAGALLAGAGCMVLGAGLMVASAGLLVAAPAMSVAAAGAGLLGAALGLMADAVLNVGKGAADMGWGLQTAGESMPLIADNALAAGVGIATLADAMARASDNLTEGSNSMAAAGDGAQKLASGVSSARSSAVSAAAAFSGMGTAATHALATIPPASSNAASSFTRLASTARTSMAAAASAAASASARIRSSMQIPDKTVHINVQPGNVRLPHFRMWGDFDPKTKEVPQVAVDWYAAGGIFPPNDPRIIGIGDSREHEAVLPLSRLESMLEPGDSAGGGDVNIYLTYNAGEDATRIVNDIADRLVLVGMAKGVSYVG